MEFEPRGTRAIDPVAPCLGVTLVERRAIALEPWRADDVVHVTATDVVALAVASHEHIGTVVADQRVPSSVADEHVPAGSAFEFVAAGTTFQTIDVLVSLETVDPRHGRE